MKISRVVVPSCSTGRSYKVCREWQWNSGWNWKDHLLLLRLLELTHQSSEDFIFVRIEIILGLVYLLIKMAYEFDLRLVKGKECKLAYINGLMPPSCSYIRSLRRLQTKAYVWA